MDRGFKRRSNDMCYPPGVGSPFLKPWKISWGVELAGFDRLLLQPNLRDSGFRGCNILTLFFLSYVYVKAEWVSTALFRQAFLNKGRVLIGQHIKFAEIVEHVVRGGRLPPPAGAAWYIDS